MRFSPSRVPAVLRQRHKWIQSTVSRLPRSFRGAKMKYADVRGCTQSLASQEPGQVGSVLGASKLYL